MSHIIGKPTFCICKNKGADQLRYNRAADQRLCFRCKDSTIPLLSKSKISGIYPSSVAVQPGLCWTWSDRFSGNPAQIILRFHVLQISQSVLVPDHNHINKPPVKERRKILVANITTSYFNQRTNGPVNAHLISWLSKAQNIQNLEKYMVKK